MTKVQLCKRPEHETFAAGYAVWCALCMNSQENDCLGFLQASMFFYLNIIRRLNTHEAPQLVYAVRSVKMLGFPSYPSSSPPLQSSSTSMLTIDSKSLAERLECTTRLAIKRTSAGRHKQAQAGTSRHKQTQADTGS